MTERTRRVGKALGYITRGHEVLVLRDLVGRLAGLLQVPGGTMEAGESPEDAVRREVQEETGLQKLHLIGRLGYHEYPCPVHDDEILLRYFFHLELRGEAPDRWEHIEMTPSAGSEPVPLELFWVTLDGTECGLWAGYGAFLPELHRRLREGPLPA